MRQVSIQPFSTYCWLFNTWPQGPSPRLYLLCWVELIAWHLRHPNREMLTSQEFLFLPLMNHNLCLAPTLKWPCVKSYLVGGWINNQLFNTYSSSSSSSSHTNSTEFSVSHASSVSIIHHYWQVLQITLILHM